jgi:hypothetical protein
MDLGNRTSFSAIHRHVNWHKHCKAVDRNHCRADLRTEEHRLELPTRLARKIQ